MTDTREKIKAIMLKRNVSQAELARRTGIQRTTINRTLNSDPSIAEKNLAKMMDALRVNKSSH